MLQINNPFPLFLDLQGALLDAGYIYIGTANEDPEVSPVATFWDAALTIPAVQPIRTRGGVIVNNGSPAFVYTGESDYSMRVRDANLDLVFYIPSSVSAAAASYQPLDADLTTISGQVNQPFGMSLLTAATSAAAKSLLALGSYLATAGGTVTGNIVRSGAGPHQYHVDGTFVSGRKYYTAAGAADPTSQVGDEWWQYAP